MFEKLLKSKKKIENFEILSTTTIKQAVVTAFIHEISEYTVILKLCDWIIDSLPINLKLWNFPIFTSLNKEKQNNNRKEAIHSSSFKCHGHHRSMSVPTTSLWNRNFSMKTKRLLYENGKKYFIGNIGCRYLYTLPTCLLSWGRTVCESISYIGIGNETLVSKCVSYRRKEVITGRTRAW